MMRHEPRCGRAPFGLSGRVDEEDLYKALYKLPRRLKGREERVMEVVLFPPKPEHV